MQHAPPSNTLPYRRPSRAPSLMPVQSSSLEILEQADISAPQARAIVQAIEHEIAGAKDTLATKPDLVVLGHGLELKIEGVRSELHAVLSSHLRQMYGAMAGQMALLLGLAYFFVTRFAH